MCAPTAVTRISRQQVLRDPAQWLQALKADRLQAFDNLINASTPPLSCLPPTLIEAEAVPQARSIKFCTNARIYCSTVTFFFLQHNQFFHPSSSRPLSLVRLKKTVSYSLSPFLCILRCCFMHPENKQTSQCSKTHKIMPFYLSFSISAIFFTQTVNTVARYRILPHVMSFVVTPCSEGESPHLRGTDRRSCALVSSPRSRHTPM